MTVKFDVETKYRMHMIAIILVFVFLKQAWEHWKRTKATCMRTHLRKYRPTDKQTKRPLYAKFDLTVIPNISLATFSVIITHFLFFII